MGLSFLYFDNDEGISIKSLKNNLENSFDISASYIINVDIFLWKAKLFYTISYHGTHEILCILWAEAIIWRSPFCFRMKMASIIESMMMLDDDFGG